MNYVNNNVGKTGLYIIGKQVLISKYCHQALALQSHRRIGEDDALNFIKHLAFEEALFSILSIWSLYAPWDVFFNGGKSS